MNETNISPDDPRLTAYALGELENAERLKLEERLRDDPAARALVSEIRALAAEMKAALAEEADGPALPIVLNIPLRPASAGKATEKAAVRTAPPPPPTTAVAEEDDPYRRKVTRFPYAMVGLAAAACFSLIFVSRRGGETQVADARPAPQPSVADGGGVASGESAVRSAEAEGARREDRLPGVLLTGSAEEFAALPVQPMGRSPERAAGGSVVSANGGGGQNFVDDPTVRRAQGGALATNGAPAEASEPRRDLAAAGANPSAHPPAAEPYAYVAQTAFYRVEDTPLSAFSVDVDTASYGSVRRFLRGGKLPPPDSVRIEELINYFPYRYAQPGDDAAPFGATMEIAAAPWNPAHRLVRIGLRGREVADTERAGANLVFLVDVSGAATESDQLPLIQASLGLLVEKLGGADRVAVVNFGDASGPALPSTPVTEKARILGALAALRPAGEDGMGGVRLAYEIARAHFIAAGANRVIFCTDRDFARQAAGGGELLRLVAEKAESGVLLSVFGFGAKNDQPAALERLADKGGGSYGFVDSRSEAERLFTGATGASLFAVARDVRLQVEFNPAQAKAYRLIGYENRPPKTNDVAYEKTDAGEIGAGHMVTALYEIVPAGAAMPEGAGAAGASVDPLKYESVTPPTARPPGEGDASGQLFTLKISYKAPTVEIGKRLEIPVIDTGAEFAAASKDFKFAAAVASLGLILRESPHKGETSYDRVLTWAKEGQGEDTDGRRQEFIDLVKRARSLSAE